MNKTGPLTAAEIQAIWESSVDDGYRQSLEAAGEGGGFEVWTQLFAQLARASLAIDVTTQALFVNPWSGQSSIPARGAAEAAVVIAFSRTGLLPRPLILRAGTLFVEEQTTDSGTDGPVVVATGRRYLLQEDVVFLAGDQGPVTAVALAEHPGYGYNNPLPGTISLVPQIGANFANDVATVNVTPAPAVLNGSPSTAFLIGDNQPDMPVPDHVGQYVYFVTGANAGTVAGAVGFVAPSSSVGSGLLLEQLWDVQVSGVSGAFVAGEILALASPSAFAVVRRYDAGRGRLVFSMTNGSNPAAATTATGKVSGATATISNVIAGTPIAAEAVTGGVGGASWRVLDWAADWGLSAVNALSPAGGFAGMLDELGDERAIARAPGEEDDSYRARVREIADVVTPNAVRRALNRALPGLPWCFREVGQSKFRGVFADGDNSPADQTPGRDRCDAFDYDTLSFTGSVSGTFREDEPVRLENATTTQVFAEGFFGRIDGYRAVTPAGVLVMVKKRGAAPASLSGTRVLGLRSGAVFFVQDVIENRALASREYRVLLGFEDFRAYFLIGLPPLNIAEFGSAWDRGAWDSAPFPNAVDGYPAGDASVRLRTDRSIDAIRAGGVGFDIYEETAGCLDDKPSGSPVFLLDPTTLGAVGLWEESGILDDGSGNVTGWNDTSGFAHHWTQATAGNRPLLIPRASGSLKRKKGVRFDGLHWLESPFDNLVFPDSVAGFTLAFLMVADAACFNASPVNPANVGATVFGDFTTATLAFGIGEQFADRNAEYVEGSVYILGTNSTFGPNLQDGGPHVIAVQRAGIDANMNVDGLPETDIVAPAYPTNPQVDRLGIGSANQDGFQGQIYAAAAFPRALSTKELRLLFFRWQALYF